MMIQVNPKVAYIELQVMFVPGGAYQISAKAATKEEAADAILHMRARIEKPAGAELVPIKTP